MAESHAPFFSVVIPTFNRKDFLVKTLNSLAIQSFPDYEVIVVDDGGNDGTDQMIAERKDPRITYIKVEKRERGAARNAGTLQARGSYITFLDSDDLVYPDLLENAFGSLQKYELPPFLHVAYEIISEDGKIIEKIDALADDDHSLLEKGNPLSCIGAFLRRDTALEFPFNESYDLSGSEDWELWLRIVANKGIKTDNRVSSALINHRTRSVMNPSLRNLTRRKDLALQFAFSDPMVEKVYRKSKNKIEGFAESYIALHLALGGKRGNALGFLLKSIYRYPNIIFHKRPYVIFKRIIQGN